MVADIIQYDPLEKPDADMWLSLDESERIHLVQSYHRKRKIRLPNAKLHALFHVAVENQVALGDQTPVEGTLQRLIKEGLTRHDAVHAIASVLASHIFDAAKGRMKLENPEGVYYSRLHSLTAASWLKNAEE